MQPELPPDRAAYPCWSIPIRFGSTSGTTSASNGLIRDLFKVRARLASLFLLIGATAARALTASPQDWFGRMLLFMGFFAAGFSYAIQFFEQRPRELWMCLALPAFAGFLGDIIVDPGPDEISSIIKVFLAVVAAFLLHLTICWCAGDYTPHEHTPINRDVLGGMN